MNYFNCPWKRALFQFVECGSQLGKCSNKKGNYEENQLKIFHNKNDNCSRNGSVFD